MTNILVVVGHTYPQQSIANRMIVKELVRQYPDAQVDDLYTLYPDFSIDVAAEQSKIEWADLIILQSPMFWYSVPSIVNRWFEEVFSAGWAYETTGHVLDGKKVIFSMTVGGPVEAYTDETTVGITEDQVIAPMRSSFTYCNMDWLGSVVTYDMPQPADSEAMKEAIHAHVESIAAFID
ncbi:NAD(P)H dehydrogenase [Bifidobacterium dolichotidis]|uniref:NAD(P)H dehydrogenase n=1 Tax=Bifidobacterium dolichotidis TaxID=2306976 RepID=A0A430FSU9_9BIFI|nr:NAD(P)H-dependent oxidoreductase [Bifidobacterium dolichotidis]RSX55935.1 NAD(P)H dehydrogenase [Bifidobacterium dolichotidis]